MKNEVLDAVRKELDAHGIRNWITAKDKGNVPCVNWVHRIIDSTTGHQIGSPHPRMVMCPNSHDPHALHNKVAETRRILREDGYDLKTAHKKLAIDTSTPVATPRTIEWLRTAFVAPVSGESILQRLIRLEENQNTIVELLATPISGHHQTGFNLAIDAMITGLEALKIKTAETAPPPTVPATAIPDPIDTLRQTTQLRHETANGHDTPTIIGKTEKPVIKYRYYDYCEHPVYTHILTTGTPKTVKCITEELKSLGMTKNDNTVAELLRHMKSKGFAVNRGYNQWLKPEKVLVHS